MRTGSCSETDQHETGGDCFATPNGTRERHTTGVFGFIILIYVLIPSVMNQRASLGIQ